MLLLLLATIHTTATDIPLLSNDAPLTMALYNRMSDAAPNTAPVDIVEYCLLNAPGAQELIGSRHSPNTVRFESCLSVTWAGTGDVRPDGVCIWVTEGDVKGRDGKYEVAVRRGVLPRSCCSADVAKFDAANCVELISKICVSLNPGSELYL